MGLVENKNLSPNTNDDKEDKADLANSDNSKVEKKQENNKDKKIEEQENKSYICNMCLEVKQGEPYYKEGNVVACKYCRENHPETDLVDPEEFDRGDANPETDLIYPEDLDQEEVNSEISEEVNPDICPDCGNYYATNAYQRVHGCFNCGSKEHIMNECTVEFEES